MIEESGSVSGSVPLTSGTGSGGPKVLWTVECSDGVSFCWHLLARNSGIVCHTMRQYFLFRLDKQPLLNRPGKPGGFPGFRETGFWIQEQRLRHC
jgi:hypothetical protein